MKVFILIIVIILSFNLWAQPKIEKLENSSAQTWWLQNNKSPLFSLAIYLGDGSFSDLKNFSGMSASSLDLSFSGTTKYTESQISEFFDRYGASVSSDVKHEYSSLYLSGLVSDIKPLVKMLCHISREANYPTNKINSYKKRLLADIANLETSPSSIASMVFRAESLSGNPALVIPSSGKKKDLNNIQATALKKKLSYLMNNVHRRIYISGPQAAQKIPKLLARECKWGSNPSFIRGSTHKPLKNIKKKPQIIFVPLANSNQAQVKLGKLLGGPAVESELPALSLVKNYLAGAGFISELITELRVKRGLTYGVAASADMQKLYGRSVISSSTKSQNVYVMLKTIRDILNNLKKGKFNSQRLKLVRKNLEGGYLFSFEKDESFLQNLMYVHHLGLDQKYIYNFPKKVSSISLNDLQSTIAKAFNWDELTIVIAGNKSLLKSLKKIRKNIKVVDWKDYL